MENKFAVDYWKKEYNKLVALSNPQEIIMQKEELNKMISKYENICMENNCLKQKLEKLEKRRKER